MGRHSAERPTTATAIDLGSPASVSVGPQLSLCIADSGWNRVAEIAGVPSVPDAPVALETIAGDRSVTVTFDNPGDDGASMITHYQYSIDGGARRAGRC